VAATLHAKPLQVGFLQPATPLISYVAVMLKVVAVVEQHARTMLSVYRTAMI